MVSRHIVNRLVLFIFISVLLLSFGCASLDFWKAKRLYEKGDYDAAITQFTALTDDRNGPTLQKSILYLGFCYLKKSDFSKAVENFQLLLDKYPDSKFTDDAVFWIARCYEEEDSIQKAIAMYQRVLTDFPRMKHYQNMANKARNNLMFLTSKQLSNQKASD